MTRVYMDHNATTPLAEAVADKMMAVLREEFGNPSSVHHFGQRAKAVVDEARSAVADLDLRPGSEVWAAVKASDIEVYSASNADLSA